MPVRRLFAYLPLLATLAVFLLCGSEAWAQTSSSGVSFPFFGGGDSNAIQGMLTAFNYQWRFFSGFSGVNNGGASALYYMAITATLIGAILIVINKKYQDAVTIGTWFILVLVMVFAPYKSQLLFYPLATPGSIAATPAGNTPSAASTGGTCSATDSNTICGFTPQVVAAHLGSTLALLVYDVFQKDGVQSLSQQVNAENAFRNDANLTAPNLDGPYKSYVNACTDQHPTPSVLPAALNGRPSGSTAAPNTTYESFSKVYRSILGNMASNSSDAPAAIVIPKLSAKGNLSSDQWASYKNGVKELKAIYASGATEPINDADYPAAVDAVTQAMATAAQGQVQDTANPMKKITSFITSAQDTTIQDSDATIQARKTFYVTQNGNNSSYDLSSGGKADTGQTSYLHVLNDDATIAAMPIMRAKFDITKNSCIPSYMEGVQTSAGAPGCEGTVTAKVGIANDCINAADSLFTSAIKGMGGYNNSNYQGLLTLLNDGTPTFSTPLQVTALCTNLTDVNSGCTSAQNMVTYINEGGDKANKTTFATTLANLIVRNSLSGNTPGQLDVASTKVGGTVLGDSKAAQVVTGVKDFVSNGISTLGLGIVGAIGYFVGNVMGNAILAIVKVLAQVALMGIIILTPFIFIMGLLIPSNAAGMLIVTTVAVFVLKFYPATIAIIDFTISTINAAQWTANGSLMGITIQGILMLVEGMMAAKVLSLSFFIMFKLGDTNNLRAITNIEDGAREIADAGAAAVAAIAVVTGTALVGGAAAAMGNKKAADWAKNRLGNQLDPTGAARAVAAPTEEGEVPEEAASLPDDLAEETMAPTPAGLEYGFDYEEPYEEPANLADIPEDLAGPFSEEVNMPSEEDLVAAGMTPGIGDGGILSPDDDGQQNQASGGQNQMGGVRTRRGQQMQGAGAPGGIPAGQVSADADGNAIINGQTVGKYIEGTNGQPDKVQMADGRTMDINPANGQLSGAVEAGGIDGGVFDATGNRIGTMPVQGPTNTGYGVQTVGTGQDPNLTDAAERVGGGAGGGSQPPSVPTVPAAAAASAGGSGNLNVNTMTVKEANLPASAQAAEQKAAIAPNDDELEWYNKSAIERFARGAWSGAVGSVAATGAIANIPGIGQLFRVAGEMANEGTEAPIRAQAFWKAGKNSGTSGFTGLSYWKAMKDQSALRMYQQREGVLAGAAAYNTLKDNGHLMSGWDNSSNAAIQVAARQMADQVGRAMVQQQKGQLTAHDYFNVNMLSSMNNPLSVKRMNFAIQEGIFDYDEYSRSRVPNASGGFTDTGFQYERTVKGFNAVLYHQDKAALEQAAAAPLQMKEATSVHGRKMWDRVEDVQRVRAKLAEDKMGSKTGPNADGDWAFVGSDGRTVVNPEQAFFVDEHHLFKPEFEATGKTTVKDARGFDKEIDVWTPKRNHRQKAQRFIREKIQDSKIRDRQVNAGGDALFWQEYAQKLTDMEGASSPLALEVGREVYNRQRRAKIFAASDDGRAIARMKEMKDIASNQISLAYAKNILDVDSAITVMANNRRVSVENPLQILTGVLAVKGFEPADIEQALSELTSKSGDKNLYKTFRAGGDDTTDMNAQTINKKVIDQYADRLTRRDIAAAIKQHVQEVMDKAGRTGTGYNILRKDGEEYIALDRAPYDPSRDPTNPANQESNRRGRGRRRGRGNPDDGVA